jgi:hypothetical protein
VCASSAVIQEGSNGVSGRGGLPSTTTHQDDAFAFLPAVCLGLVASAPGARVVVGRGKREGSGGEGGGAVDADVGGEQAQPARGVPSGSAQAAAAAAAGAEAEAGAAAVARAGVRHRPPRPHHRLPVAVPQEADPGVVMSRSAGWP